VARSGAVRAGLSFAEREYLWLSTSDSSGRLRPSRSRFGNGADVVVIGICGRLSTASNAKAATPEYFDDTVKQIRGSEYGLPTGPTILSDVSRLIMAEGPRSPNV
jgi:hypothetical protein